MRVRREKVRQEKAGSPRFVWHGTGFFTPIDGSWCVRSKGSLKAPFQISTGRQRQWWCSQGRLTLREPGRVETVRETKRASAPLQIMFSAWRPLLRPPPPYHYYFRGDPTAGRPPPPPPSKDTGSQPSPSADMKVCRRLDSPTQTIFRGKRKAQWQKHHTVKAREQLHGDAYA